MKTHTNNYQIINDYRGLPAFVVIPFNEFQRMQARPEIDFEKGVPSEVVEMVIVQELSPLRAWREYLGLTQADVAQRLGVSQSAYSQHEKASYLRKTTREKIAVALGIYPEQLDIY